MTNWWKELTTRQQAGGTLSVFAVVLTFLIAGTSEATGSTPLLLAVFAAVAQFAAAWLFAGHGKAEPAHAQASVRDLIRLGTRAAEAKKVATDAYEQTEKKLTAQELKTLMSHLSIHLSYIEDDCVCAIDDWRLFSPQAVGLAEGKNGTDDGDDSNDTL